MKYLFFLILSILCISCDNTEGKHENTKQNYEEFSYNGDYDKKFDRKIELSLNDSLSMDTPPTSPNLYFDSYIYNDSLFFGINPPNNIDVYNLNSKLFIKNIEIPEHILKGDLQNIYVKSFDSIYATNYFPPIIYHLNYDGMVVNKIAGDVLKLNIQNERVPLNEVNYRFPFYLTYQKPQVIDDKLYLVIEPIGSAKRDGFKKTQRIGVFDLHNSRWEKAICEPKGLMSLDKTFFNQDLMNPYFIIVENKIYVTYPMSHYVYIYDLDGECIDHKLISFSKIKKMPNPLTGKELNDRQKSWNFRIMTPFYGPLFYHQNLKIFSRVFHEEQDLYGADGLLNDGHNRSGYIIFFDNELNKIGEFEFENAKLGIGKVSPLSDGLLLGRSSKYWKNENEFHQKYLFKIEQYNGLQN